MARAKRRSLTWQKNGKIARTRVPLGAPLQRVRTASAQAPPEQHYDRHLCIWDDLNQNYVCLKCKEPFKDYDAAKRHERGIKISAGGVERIPMSELRQKSQAAGQHWFDRDTMRFFNSKVPQYAYKKGNEAFFISSEQFIDRNRDITEPRKFTIRKMNLSTGEIDTLGEFQGFTSKESARIKLNELLGIQGRR